MGYIDCLISNADVSLHEGNIQNVTEEGFDKQFNTNLKGDSFLAKAFVEMKLKEAVPLGHLLIISFETGNQSYDIPYDMTKVAMNSFTKVLSRRFYQGGLRVNAIAL